MNQSNASPLLSGRHPLAGVVLKLSSTLMFAIMAALVKIVSRDYPVTQIVFFRSFFSLLPIIVVALHSGEGFAFMRTQRPVGHALRSLSGVFSMFLNFAALSMLPLAEATALAFAAPLFAVMLAVWLLGERVGIYRWSAVIVGFCGVLLIARPVALITGAPGAVSGQGFILGVLGACFTALSLIFMRRLTQVENPSTIVFYFSLTTTIVSAVTLPFTAVRPTLLGLALLSLTGIVGGVAQLLYTASYRFANVTTLAPFDYVQLVWVTVLSYLVFDYIPVPIAFAGFFLITASGLFIILREHIRARNAGLDSSPQNRTQTPAT
jgi:drug/metabolite transporter (DMT)-like permease